MARSISEEKGNAILNQAFAETLVNEDFEFIELSGNNFLFRPTNMRAFFIASQYLRPLSDRQQHQTTRSTSISAKKQDLPSFPIYNVSKTFNDEKSRFQVEFNDIPYLSFCVVPKSKSTAYKRKRKIRDKAAEEQGIESVNVYNVATTGTVDIEEYVLEFLTALHLKKEGYIVGRTIYKPRDEHHKRSGIHIPDLYAFKSPETQSMLQEYKITNAPGFIFEELHTVQELGEVKGEGEVDTSEFVTIEVEPSYRRRSAGYTQLTKKPGYFTKNKGFDRGLLVAPQLQGVKNEDYAVDSLGFNKDGINYYTSPKMREDLEQESKEIYERRFRNTIKMALIGNMKMDRLLQIGDANHATLYNFLHSLGTSKLEDVCQMIG